MNSKCTELCTAQSHGADCLITGNLRTFVPVHFTHMSCNVHFPWSIQCYTATPAKNVFNVVLFSVQWVSRNVAGRAFRLLSKKMIMSTDSMFLNVTLRFCYFYYRPVPRERTLTSKIASHFPITSTFGSSLCTFLWNFDCTYVLPGIDIVLVKIKGPPKTWLFF